MYKQLSRAPSRDIAGHVCLSCRRHLYIRRQLYVAQQQRRHQGQVSAAQHGRGVDDWIDTFNDLSLESPTPKLSEKAHEDGRPFNKKKKEEDWKPPGYEDLKKRLHDEKDETNFQDLRHALRDVGITTRRKELKKASKALREGKPGETDATRTKGRNAKSGRLARDGDDAQVSVEDHASIIAEARSQTTLPASEIDESQASAERSRFEQILADIDFTPPLSAASMPDPPPEIEPQDSSSDPQPTATDYASAEQSIQPPDSSSDPRPIVTDDASAEQSTRPPDSSFDPQPIVTDDASAEQSTKPPFKFTKVISNSKIPENHLPSSTQQQHQEAVDHVPIPPGQVSPSAQALAEGAFGPHAAVQSPLKPQKAPFQSRKSQVRPSTSHVSPNNIVNSLASKARHVRDRPKWGGLSMTPHQPTTLKPSFDTLRQADQVSPLTAAPATAYSAKPWGLSAVAAGTPGFTANVPGDVGGESGGRSGDENENRGASGSGVGTESLQGNGTKKRTSGFGFGFKRLKAILYGDAEGETAAAGVAQTQAAAEGDASSPGTTEPVSDNPPAEDPTSASAEQSAPDDRLAKLYAAQQERNARHEKKPTTLPVDDTPVETTPSAEQATSNGEVSDEAAKEDHRADPAPVPEQAHAVKDPRRLHRTAAHARQRAKPRPHLQREKAKKAQDASAGGTQAPAPQASPVYTEPQESAQHNGRPLWEVMQGKRFAEAVSGPMSESVSARTPVAAAREDSSEEPEDSGTVGDIIDAKELQVTALNVPQPPVPGLAYGLDRVLFNPGVYQLQDPHSRVYNFDNYLQNIMPVTEFDFNALKEYKTSSQDVALASIAKEHGKKYVGSTSSMTSTLAHFHYLLSNWRDINLSMLSQGFQEDRKSFTQINRAPTAIFLRYKPETKTYAIDADKEYDSGNVLMMLGKSMEKLLTLPKDDYERYRKSDARQVSAEEREAPEAFEYTTMGDFLMRSQLDAYDKRLPGQGMFDIKTRAVVSIRMQTTDYVPMLGYQIHTLQGRYESYEREYYDMLRSTMLKYMLQARMGRMDGIFLAYHNVQRIFGFQYLQLAEIDRAIHGQVDRSLGDQEFRVSLELLNKALDQATAKFPEKNLRLHFETRASPLTAMYIFAEPMEDEQIDEIQSKSKGKIAEFEREMMGIEPEKRPAAVEATTPLTTETEKGEEDSKPTPSPTNDEQSPYHDSTSPANQPFIDSILPSPTSSPLYAATIVLDSFVNGDPVDRPTRLRKEDDWQVEYLLKEMDPRDAWGTYQQTMANRKKAFDSGEKDGAKIVEGEDGMEGVVAEPEYNAFFEELKRLAREGREYRSKMDGLEEGRRAVVFREGEGLGGGEADVGGEMANETSRGDADRLRAIEAQSAEADEVEKVDGVEGYMSWLYKRR